MISKIKATAINYDSSIKSSNQKAAIAGKECIEKAGMKAQDIDLLINVGLFRDQNMCEPAMSAMIQKEIGINPDFGNNPVDHAAFSFDLMEGACGFIKAIQVADSLLKIGKVRSVLIVSSNVHPSNEEVPGFPYKNIGAAMLLIPSDETGSGFTNFVFQTSEEGNPGSTAYLDLASADAEGRNKMEVYHEDDYNERLLAYTSKVAKDFIDKNSINKDRTLLLTSYPNDDFTQNLASSLSFSTDTSFDLHRKYGDAHTSSLPLGYNNAADKGILAKYDQILFVNSGSGLSAGCALYTL